MKLARKKGIPNKRNKTRQIKLIPSNSINFSISSSHAWEKSFPLYQSRALPIFPIFPILYLLWLIILSPRHFISFLSVFHYPSYLRSFEILDPPFNLAPASRFLKHTRDSIPFFLSPFLPRYYRPLSLFWNHRLSTLVAIPRFHPRDNLSPRYTISLRIRSHPDVLLIFHHPSTSSAFHLAPPSPFVSRTRRVTYRNHVSPCIRLQSFGLFTSILDFI